METSCGRPQKLNSRCNSFWIFGDFKCDMKEMNLASFTAHVCWFCCVEAARVNLHLSRFTVTSSRCFVAFPRASFSFMMPLYRPLPVGECISMYPILFMNLLCFSNSRQKRHGITVSLSYHNIFYLIQLNVHVPRLNSQKLCVWTGSLRLKVVLSENCDSTYTPITFSSFLF